MGRFWPEDLWEIDLGRASQGRALLLQGLRIGVLTYRGLTGNRWWLRAAALTYYSALSIVPALAMAFGVAKGFGLESILETALRERIVGQEEVLTRVLGFARNALENVKGGLMAGVALVFLFWAVFQVLSYIEGAFNDIWGVPRDRRLGRKITDYLAFMLIAPFFLIASSVVTVAIMGQVQFMVERVELLAAAGPAIFWLFQLLPFVVVWVLFTMLYVTLPNTRVRVRSGALAGVTAGTLFQLFQQIYFHLQFVLAGYNAVYGSFAALPLFFIWLQTSWVIVLLGAGISRAHQHLGPGGLDVDPRDQGRELGQLLALLVTQALVRAFLAGRAARPEELARELGVTPGLVGRTLGELTGAGLAVEVASAEIGVGAFQPAVDPDRLTIHFVLEALARGGGPPLPTSWAVRWPDLLERCRQLAQAAERSPANARLKDLDRGAVDPESYRNLPEIESAS